MVFGKKTVERVRDELARVGEIMGHSPASAGTPVAPRQSAHDFRVYGNYTGPGNRTDSDYLRRYPPVDALDRAAMRHDLYYPRERPGRYDYLHFNDADEQFLEDVSGIPGWRARAAESYFKAKRALSSRKRESEFSPGGSSSGIKRSSGGVVKSRRPRKRKLTYGLSSDPKTPKMSERGKK